ncbi:MAG: hypothetical protein KKF46_05595 [Nanoarchaeota archaeon]|nr:hypothetical protein [Nanoarchaeota archaeon]MBU1321806.1 hypothetical protein [Nanoarchaeota archaeon]MBU1598253.1 hypothetical protein [Nanoarchaeota archaeon]MBU2441718.1 hypothetical protein [Nanoarchaeota archaeon]
MESYREQRIKDHRKSILAGYQRLPDKCKHMTMEEYNTFLPDYAKTALTDKVTSAKKIMAVNFRNNINNLVDMNKLDFDIDATLEDICKIVEKDLT